MPSFDESKAYATQEEIFFDDGREEELVEYITCQPDLKGSPAGILKAIDQYGHTKKYLMNVGENKGNIVTDIIRERKPKVMIELGGYCGYSTILFAQGVDQYYSLERSPKFAKNIRALVEFAGLKNVEVIVGPSNEGIQKLYDGGLRNIDMMFLDHYKPAYTTDLKLCESLGMISKGTVLAADNVISPGNPPYLSYVRSNVHEKREALTRETNDTENFPGRSAEQYGGVEKLKQVKGNPNLVYESELVESWEPTGLKDGVEITKCMGVDDGL